MMRNCPYLILRCEEMSILPSNLLACWEVAFVSVMAIKGHVNCLIT